MMSVSPLIGLAAAAGFAGIVALGTWAAASRRLTADAGRVAVAPATGPAAGAARAADTVHIVRFVFVSREARDVALVGDFNGWAKGATRLEPAGRPGVWTVSVALPPGRHEYAFIVDGRQWATDPFAAPHADEFGTESSVVTIGRHGASAS
jgi:1,4-alpha-glucan branching enzyme